MATPNASLQRNVENHFRAIDLCLAAGLRMPALILIYSAMDFLAWLCRPKRKLDVDKEAFIGWAQEFVVDMGFSQCRAVDLYSARCAHLHSNGFESKMTRDGKASKILYAWGSAEPQHLLEVLALAGHADAKVVHVETLVAAVRKGAVAALGAAMRDEARRDEILARAGKFFMENQELDGLVTAFGARQPPEGGQSSGSDSPTG